MTLPPLEGIRLGPRSHVSALQWIGLLYRRPESIDQAGKSLSSWQRLAAALRLYLHTIPYLIIIGLLGRWFIFGVSGLEARQGSSLNPWWIEGLRLHGLFLIVGLGMGLAVAFAVGLAVSLAVGLASGMTVGLASSLALGLAFGLTHGLAGRAADGLFFGPAFGLACGLIGGVASRLRLAGALAAGPDGGVAEGLVAAVASGLAGCLAVGLALYLSGRLAGDLAGVLVAGGAYFIGFLRLYYLPVHGFWLGPRLRSDIYRLHPVAWDNVCLLPFPLFDRLLVAYAERDPKAGNREIDRLIDEYPSQRRAALRARAILVIRRAAALESLARLDEVLASLPAGKTSFLKETSDLRHRAHAITALQARLDTLDRPFLREPFAALLTKEIENFGQQVAGFEPPLSTELRKAARRWLEIARNELDAARSAAIREPTRQVFRAGDPVDREREAFVPRAAILGELERQVMLATGCPGLLLYGRRRMGKSTLLRNLEGLLPPRVLVVQLSMQEAGAFASLPDLVGLIGRRVALAVSDVPEPPANLKGLESFLTMTQMCLEDRDDRLLLAIDEYENLDRKIGQGVISEDLLAVLRESIQTHRRIIWTFAGSHGVEDLGNAPWTSYLVSTRTLEVTPFEPAETRLLLTEPLKHSSLWSSVEADRPRFEPGFWGAGGIQRIHDEAGGWPHLVQLVAETVIDLVNDSGSARVDAALLERALDRAVLRGTNVFFELVEKESRLPGEWDYLMAFHAADELPPPADEAVGRALRRRRLVVEQDERFHLRVPLISRWLRRRL
jgi:hypothetical protein